MVSLPAEPVDDRRQGLHRGVGFGGIVHQHHAQVAPFGVAPDVCQDLVRVGVPAGGVLGRHVPVDPLVAFFLRLADQLLHDAAAAVFVADGVGAAAGEAQPVDVFHIHIGRDGLPQRLDVQPERLAAGIDLRILVGGAVQGHLVTFGLDVGQQRQIVPVDLLRHHKKGSGHVPVGQDIQDRPGVGGRPVVKGQAGDLQHHGLGRIIAGVGGGLHRKHVVGDGGLPRPGPRQPAGQQPPPAQRQRAHRAEPQPQAPPFPCQFVRRAFHSDSPCQCGQRPRVSCCICTRRPGSL